MHKRYRIGAKGGRRMELDRMIADFEDMVGWPYASPGTGDERGIDCSGAFVRAYRLQGKSLYHGSNRMAREACSWVRPIGQTALRCGTVVFKARDSGLPSAYQPGGAHYRADMPENFYHVGLVVRDVPLRIIHATPPKVRADTTAKGWSHAGWLKEIREEADGRVTRQVQAESVNLRAEPSKKAALLGRIPQGTSLEVEAADKDWVRVVWQGKEGYVMAQYLTEAGSVKLSRTLAQALYEALGAALKEEGSA